MHTSTCFPLPSRIGRRKHHRPAWKRAGLTCLLLFSATPARRVHAQNFTYWRELGDGSWNVGINWANLAVPDGSDDVSNGTPYSITLDTTGYANQFHNLGGLIVQNATLNLVGNQCILSQLGGTVTLNNSTLEFNVNSTVTGFGEMTGGTVTLNGARVGAALGATLFIEDGTLVHGTGTVGGNYSSYTGGSLINQGKISADVSGQSLNIQPGYDPTANALGLFTNKGILQAINGGNMRVDPGTGGTIAGVIIAADNGTVDLFGTGKLDNTTTIETFSGGSVQLYGVYDNQNPTHDPNYALTIADGSLSFYDGTLRNSVVNVTGSGVGLDFTGHTGTLDNVKVNGTISVSGYSYGFANILNNLAATNITLFSGGTLQFLNSGTLSCGNVLLSSASVMRAQAGATLTLDSGTFVHGTGSVGLYGGNLVNNGTISSDVSGQTMSVQTGRDPNTGLYSTGTLQALNGSSMGVSGAIGGNVTASGSGSSVSLYGTGNLADATTIRATNGGRVYLSGDYDNQNHTITIADGSLSLNDGTLRNSVVNVTGSGAGLDFIGNGTLDNVRVNGTINVSGVANILNNLAAANITLGSGIVFLNSGTLSCGNVLLSGNIGAQQGTTLTLDSSTFVHGAGGVGTISVFGNGGIVVNNGTISADVSGQSLNVQSGNGNGPNGNQYATFTNNGTLQAINGGTLNVNNSGGNAVNTGTIKADAGSSIFLSNTTQTAGQTIANGTITTNSSDVFKGGSVVGNGTISGPLTSTGATVSAGSLTTAGKLTVTGGYTQDAASTLLVNLGGTGQGSTFDLVSVFNTASLHGTVDVQLLNGFNPFVGETFDFLTYKNRVGVFDNVVSLDAGYTYNVTYNDATGIGRINVITGSAPVPEAGTVVSLALLLGGAGFLARRQRKAAAQSKAA